WTAASCCAPPEGAAPTNARSQAMRRGSCGWPVVLVADIAISFRSGLAQQRALDVEQRGLQRAETGEADAERVADELGKAWITAPAPRHWAARRKCNLAQPSGRRVLR